MPYNALGLPLEYCSASYRQQQKALKNSPTVLWMPKDPESTPMSRYRQHINRKYNQQLQTSHDLHRWSVTEPHSFWIDMYNYTGIIPALPPGTSTAYDSKIKMRDIPPFFPGHKLNYAENVLVPNAERNPHAIAITGLRETALDNPENITWAELWELVRVTRSALLRSDIKQDDVVAAFMSNSIWIIVTFLATASIGAYFTSISPDMGVAGCISRLTQVNPKIVFADTDYALRGVRHSLLHKIQQVQQSFAKSSLTSPKVVFVPTTHRPHLHPHMEYVKPLGTTLHHFLKVSSPKDKLIFTRVPTTHPLVILYSSGTTGTPKCILSSHMSILNYKKIAFLHNSLDHTSTVFQYSSTSWVVWNIMLGHLSVGARLITYDGGALYPSPATLLQICEKYKVTYWGTSPRYLLELEQSKSSGIDPKSFDLSNLRMITTTGATLTGPQMRWFYTVFPPTIHLSSIAGGTEIASSWMASDPAGPVHENEMQMWALGQDCDILDPITGQSVMNQNQNSSSLEIEIGELVCRKTFPSQPVGFWNDPHNKKYHESYFERFPLPLPQPPPSSQSQSQPPSTSLGKIEYLDVWTQHDITTHHPLTHGLQITSRSDSTLNPSGIRFGPSEIYSILSLPSSPLKSKISDSLCVGRKRSHDKDEVVFLFIIPSPGISVDDALISEVKREIGRGLSDRHVPKFVVGLPEGGIPYTVNGKKVEVLVKKILSGDVDVDELGNIVGGGKAAGGMVSTIINTQCLGLYRKYRDVEREVKTKQKKRAKL